MQVSRRPLMTYAIFLIIGIVVGAAAIYGVGPIKEVPGPTVTQTVTTTAVSTVTKTETAPTTSADEMPCLPLHPRSLANLNLNVSDLKKKLTTFSIQTRNSPYEFKLIDYPSGMGGNFDAKFLGQEGFRRSHGIEISTENSKICSVVLEFENCSGARESYYRYLDFLSNRVKYTSFPYVTIFRWNDVEDLLGHFIVPAMEHMDPTEIPNLGERASRFYNPMPNDQLHDFYYVVSFSKNLLIFVGETGSLENAIAYARVVESKIRLESSLKPAVSKLQLSLEMPSDLYEVSPMITSNTSLSTATKPLVSFATPL